MIGNKKLHPNESLGTDSNMIVISKRGRTLKVGNSDNTDMFAQILNIERLNSLIPPNPNRQNQRSKVSSPSHSKSSYSNSFETSSNSSDDEQQHAVKFMLETGQS